MTKAYRQGFKKAAEACGLDGAMLLKLATYGDIINAGYGSMTMGSPFAPKPYQHGTSSLKTTDQLQNEQKSNAIGGLAGLALSSPYSWKALRFLVPRLRSVNPSYILKNPAAWAKSPKTWYDLATYADTGLAVKDFAKRVGPSLAPAAKTVLKGLSATSDLMHAQRVQKTQKEFGDNIIGNSVREYAGKTLQGLNKAQDTVDSVLGNAHDFADSKLGVARGKAVDQIKDYAETARAIGQSIEYAPDTAASAVQNLGSTLTSALQYLVHGEIDRRRSQIRDAEEIANKGLAVRKGLESGGLQGAAGAGLNEALGKSSVPYMTFSDTIEPDKTSDVPEWRRYLFEAGYLTPWTRPIVRPINNGYNNQHWKGMPWYTAYPYGVLQSLPLVNRFSGWLNKDKTE